MLKKYFTCLILSAAFCLPAFSSDAVFSNPENQEFQLQPLDYSSKPIVNAVEDTPKSYGIRRSQNTIESVENVNSSISDQNFMDALNNLDNAQINIREQLSTYNALMVQSKAEYLAKKEEYQGYKRQYNLLKKRMQNIEKSKKLIQGNVNVQNYSN